MSSDKARATRNEASRKQAGHNNDLWSENEIDILMDLWSDDQTSADLLAMAELLGRTVEACRQKYYLLVKKRDIVPAEVKKSVQRLDKWSRGFTSLEDMGY